MRRYFRDDEYGCALVLELADGACASSDAAEEIRKTRYKNQVLIPFEPGVHSACGVEASMAASCDGGVVRISVEVRAQGDVSAIVRASLRLGVDCYMDSYPQWNEKLFPTAMRCEKNGFWGVLCSPSGKMLALASPSRIVSWKNCYSDADYDVVGHRIYTCELDLMNAQPQPPRHPRVSFAVTDEPINAELFLSFVEGEAALYTFVQKYAHIHVPTVSRLTLAPDEPMLVDGREYTEELPFGQTVLKLPDGYAEVRVARRREWEYYLECAARSAEKCQQKPGTHCEAWYGWFSRVLWATHTGEGIDGVRRDFDEFFSQLTQVTVDGKVRLKDAALPFRVQNSSALLSLLADVYEMTGDVGYLDAANDIAEYFMTLRAADGSFRCYGKHYTCVIYPAKSLIELSDAEERAGLCERADVHFECARLAIEDLERRLDDIATEGQSTFEDGMITCEALQLAALARHRRTPPERRAALTEAAEYLMQKHRCLEQLYIPDCRTRGCTLRFWEARYDVNFFANAITAPHGWTAWKLYAVYYLYELTGKAEYLRELDETLGACALLVGDDGELRWGFVVDPCVTGVRPVRCCNGHRSDGEIATETVTLGECYVEMVSDWWRHDPEMLINEYLDPWNKPQEWYRTRGGSCDNDVHEIFKALHEIKLEGNGYPNKN